MITKIKKEWKHEVSLLCWCLVVVAMMRLLSRNIIIEKVKTFRKRYIKNKKIEKKTDKHRILWTQKRELIYLYTIHFYYVQPLYRSVHYGLKQHWQLVNNRLDSLTNPYTQYFRNKLWIKISVDVTQEKEADMMPNFFWQKKKMPNLLYVHQDTSTCTVGIYMVHIRKNISK